VACAGFTDEDGIGDFDGTSESVALGASDGSESSFPPASKGAFEEAQQHMESGIIKRNRNIIAVFIRSPTLFALSFSSQRAVRKPGLQGEHAMRTGSFELSKAHAKDHSVKAFKASSCKLESNAKLI
jgi:hypothetical protein